MKTKRVSVVSRPGRREIDAGPAARARIVAAARDLFLQRGFQGTTADEIAGLLGISKATLYKAFRSKEDILREVVRGIMDEIQAGIEDRIDDASLGFVEKMAALLGFLAERISLFGPFLARDIQRTAPDIWREIDAFRRDKILKNFRIVLGSGRREGIFRADVDLDLLLRMFLGLVQQFVTPDEVRRTGRSPAEILESIIKVFFQGILTDKGRLDLSARTPALFGPRKESAL